MQRLTWVVAACAFAVLVLCATVWIIAQDRAETRARAQVETASIAHLLATQAQDSLNAVQNALDRGQTIVQALEQGLLTPEQARDRLNDMVIANPAIGTIWAVRQDGSSWIDNTNASPQSPGVTQRHYFQVHRDGQMQFVGPVETGTIRPRPRLTVSTRLVNRDQQFAGVIVAGVDAAHFLTLLTNARFSPGLSASLSTDQSLPLLATEGRPPDRDREIISSSRMLTPPGIRLDVERDMSFLLEDWRRRAFLTATGAATLCALFIGLISIGYRAAGRELAARHKLEQLTATLEDRIEHAQAEIRQMFRELKHRVKNNLAVVMSLLQLQKRASDNADVKKALTTIEARVGVIEDLYRDLDGEHVAEFDAAALVRKIATKVAAAMQQSDHAIRIQIGGAPLAIRSESAVPLGLFLNEALTNAFKHADVDTAEGGVTLSLLPLPEGYKLCISNPKGEHWVQESGQGSRIMRALAKQLEGELVVTDDGQVYAVSLEVRTAKAPEKSEPARDLLAMV